MSRLLTIDELEILTPDQLGVLLLAEVHKDSPDVQYIQDILDVGCHIDAKNDDGLTALILAVSNRHYDLVTSLVFKGAEVNARDNWGWTALHWAVRRGYPELLSFLISKGADIYAKSIHGQRAWDIAHNSIKEALPELEPL